MTEAEKLFSKVIVIGRTASAFAGSHEFGKLERETSDITDGSGTFAMLLGTMGMSAVLNHNKIVFSCNGIDLIHISHGGVKMNGNNGFCPGCDGFFDLDRINAEGIRVNINNHGLS